MTSAVLRATDNATIAVITAAVAPRDVQRANSLGRNFLRMLAVSALKEARVAAAARHICIQPTCPCEQLVSHPHNLRDAISRHAPVSNLCHIPRLCAMQTWTDVLWGLLLQNYEHRHAKDNSTLAHT